MPKIMIDCPNPNDLNSLEAAIEKHFGKCNITYAEQAKAMIEAKVVETEHQAEKEIAKQIGESLPSVHARVQRGKKLVQHEQQTPSSQTSSESKQNKEISKGVTAEGKPRQRAPGAGRKPKYCRKREEAEAEPPKMSKQEERSWRIATDKLEKLAKHMLTNCPTPNGIDKEIKQRFIRYFDTLEVFRDELENISTERR